MAVTLMVIFVLMSFAPPLQTLFSLEPLEWQYVAIVAVAVPVWLLLVRLFWRRRVLDRFLGVGDKAAAPAK